MPKDSCYCACHYQNGIVDVTHRCCVHCPFCQSDIPIKNYDTHLEPCRKAHPQKPAPETD